MTARGHPLLASSGFWLIALAVGGLAVVGRGWWSGMPAWVWLLTAAPALALATGAMLAPKPAGVALVAAGAAMAAMLGTWTDGWLQTALALAVAIGALIGLRDARGQRVVHVAALAMMAAVMLQGLVTLLHLPVLHVPWRDLLLTLAWGMFGAFVPRR